jgi:hypothetical protein
MTSLIPLRPAVRGGLGVRGRARVTVRDRKGRLRSQRVFDNLETQYALNAIATWLVGGAGVIAPAAPSYLAFGVGPINQLAASLADMETNPTGWQASSNCTVPQSSAKAWQGLYSTAVTASSAATMTATTPAGLNAVPVTAGYQYAADAHFLANSSTRSVGINIAWYDSTGTIISTSTGTTKTDSASTWTRAGVVATAPSNAAFAAVQATVTSPGNGEIHYLDGAQLAYAPDGPYAWRDGYTGAAWAPVTPQVSDTGLSQERYLARAPLDAAYTQAAVAVMLHTYQQSDPTGSFYEAAIFDAPVSSAATLAVAANAGDTTLTLAGSAAPAVTAGMQIYIPSVPLSAPAAPAFSGASGTGGYLVGGTTYYYTVTATDSYGETIPGAEANYTPPTTTATNTVTLTWAAVPGATGYKVYRSTVSGNEQLLASFSSTTGSYVDNTNTTPSGFPPSVDSSGGHGEYATIATAAAAGATTWTLTDELLYPHTATIVSGTTTLPATVVAFTGNLWAHVALTGVAKTGTNLLTLQWEISVADAT